MTHFKNCVAMLQLQELPRLAIFLALLHVVHLSSGQVSTFKVLSSEELSNISLRQNPELLNFAARTGETIRINVSAAEQGAVIQEGVTAVLDCGPWLRNYPGGTVRWLFYRYSDLDHTDLRPPIHRKESDPYNALLITGEFNETYTIVYSLAIVDNEDFSRGIYECEVCVNRFSESEVCHSANTTIATVGRPPIIDAGVGTGTFNTMQYLAKHNHSVANYMCCRL